VAPRERPPQTIIRLPDQTTPSAIRPAIGARAVGCHFRDEGAAGVALDVLVGGDTDIDAGPEGALPDGDVFVSGEPEQAAASTARLARAIAVDRRRPCLCPLARFMAHRLIRPRAVRPSEFEPNHDPRIGHAGGGRSGGAR
jgi:hypothetical protein